MRNFGILLGGEGAPGRARGRAGGGCPLDLLRRFGWVEHGRVAPGRWAYEDGRSLGPIDLDLEQPASVKLDLMDLE